MRLACLLLAALSCAGQHLLVYSPLTRIGPDGEVVKPDRGKAEPRHILSPGIPRNAWSSFRVVVELAKPEAFQLDIGQNPENAVKAVLYREEFVQTPLGLIPDGLTQVPIPYKAPLSDFKVPGQKVVTFWLDMWVDRNAPVDRVKVEPQLYLESLQDWIVYPMEVRIQQPVVASAVKVPAYPLPAVEAPADRSAYPFVQAAVCGTTPRTMAETQRATTARHMLRRNIAQHFALTKDVRPMFIKAAAVADPSGWCKSPATPAAGPEWYLRLRDLIYRQAGAGD